MQSDQRARTNGELSLDGGNAAASSELDDLRATCRRQLQAIDTLRRRALILRRRTAALRAENAELRAENDHVRRRLTSGSRVNGRVNGRVDVQEAIEVRIALDVHAPGAARHALANGLRTQVPEPMLWDALLLVSELVTNSLCHSGASVGDVVVVRVELAPGLLHVEVEDRGRAGMVAPREADRERGGGFGLALVQSISERWGVERVASGGTRVWAQLARPAVTA
jgi:anti-sigma regulatory factor (Ser/Thr protein kinase)